MAAMDYIKEHPVVNTWSYSYKLDEAAFSVVRTSRAMN